MKKNTRSEARVQKSNGQNQFSADLLSAILNSIHEGILVIGLNGKVITYNSRFVEMWKIPHEILVSCEDKVLLDFVVDQLTDPDLFLSRVKELYDKPSEESLDSICFKDGRIFERITRPMYIGSDIEGRVWSFRDITGQRKAEKALSLNVAKFHAAFDQSPVGSVICDLGKVLLKCNQAFCNFLGYPEDELIGKTVEEITFPEDIRLGMNELEKLIEKKVFSAPVQKRYLTKDGRVVWGEVKISIVLNEHNSPQFVMAVVQDINERKQLEESLSTTRWELQAIFNNTPVMLALIDTERRVLFSNAAFNEFSGLLKQNGSSLKAGNALGCLNSFEDPRGCGFGKNCESCTLRLAINDTFNQGAGQYDLEFRAKILKQDKQQEVILMASTVPIQEEGRQNLLLCLTDITEKVLQDETLKRLNEFMKLVVETANEGILSIDLDNNLQYANQKMANILDCGIEEIIGKPVTDFISPEEFEDHKSKMNERRKGETGLYERRFRRKSGGEVWTLISASPIKDENGTVIGSFGMVQDITERKNAENLRIESEKKYFSLYSNMNEGVALHQLILSKENLPEDYIILDINAAFETQAGIMRDSIIGKTSKEAYGVEDPPYLETYAKVALSGEPASFETYFPPLAKYFSISVYCPQKGSFATVFKDITTIKKAEEALRESEGSLNDIFQTVNEGISYTDITGNVLSINMPLERILGVSKDEIVGKNIKELAKILLPPEKSKQVLPLLSDITNGKNIDPLRIEYKEKILEIVTNINRRTRRVIGVVRDITEHERVDKALRESEEKYRILLENSGIGVGVYSLDGTVQLFNQKALQNLGGKAEDFIGKSLIEIFGRQRGEEYLLRISDAAKSDKSLEYEDFFQYQGDAYWFLSNHTRIMNSEGTILGVQVLSHDISEIKNVERELRIAKEKAEESDSFKTAFLQNISHEIRTPMNAIIGFSRLINKEDLDPEKRKNYCNIIVQSSEQLMTLVNDILTISSLETHQEKLFIEEIDLNKLMSDLHAIFAMQITNQEISLDFHPGLPDQKSIIRTDKGKINQILSNLLTNAKKFTNKGSIEFGYSKKETELEFFVRDSGIGIKPEVQDKIFERFHQADLTISREYGGTGLGLAICRGFVHLLGGRIWVESQPGKGSAFYFTIPQ